MGYPGCHFGRTCEGINARFRKIPKISSPGPGSYDVVHIVNHDHRNYTLGRSDVTMANTTKVSSGPRKTAFQRTRTRRDLDRLDPTKTGRSRKPTKATPRKTAAGVQRTAVCRKKGRSVLAKSPYKAMSYSKFY